MPIRKRMSPIARRARSKRRMRPKRRKKPPFLKREEIRKEVGRAGGEWEALVGKGLIWGDMWGGFLGGSVPTACAECYADFWRERVSILYML